MEAEAFGQLPRQSRNKQGAQAGSSARVWREMRAPLSPIGGAQTESWRHMFGEPESMGGTGKGGWFVPPLALGRTAAARCGDSSRTHDSSRAPSSARLSHAREPLRRRSLSDGDGDGVEDR
jgi:hypothetical protein